jgi:hypothetical protein
MDVDNVFPLKFMDVAVVREKAVEKQKAQVGHAGFRKGGKTKNAVQSELLIRKLSCRNVERE